MNAQELAYGLHTNKKKTITVVNYAECLHLNDSPAWIIRQKAYLKNKKTLITRPLKTVTPISATQPRTPGFRGRSTNSMGKVLYG